jgi:hypothetical protein
MLRVRTRVLILCVVCAIGLGAGVQWAQADAYNWCRTRCDQVCEDSDGCDVSQAVGCSCYYFCGNGREGVEICMQ